jgi:Family of unknown function (DUF6335)
MNKLTPQSQADLENANDSTSFVESTHIGVDDLDAEMDDLDTEMDNLAMEESLEDLPQEITESYGTGVKEIPGYLADGRMGQGSNFNEASSVLTGGDIDANYEQANAEGDESVGGTVVTPDMDVVDDLGKAVGLEMDDANFLHTSEILEQRDGQRWELEPKSSEDYQDRRAQESSDD